MSSNVVLPGEQLGLASEFDAGAGTFVEGELILASVAGEKVVLPTGIAGEGSAKHGMVLVLRGGSDPAAIVPEVGDIVTGKITRINARQAFMRILVVGEKAVREPFAALIRKENIRDRDIDRLEVSHCFRPGDIVRAEVISLGDSRSYFLSTAQAELGVVYAESEEGGHPMIPVSYREVRCVETGARERRKVARVGF